MRAKDTNSRHDKIFDVIIRSYIETAEPVGSRTISKQADLSLSPASIRNVMADLEEQGLLAQPHTSAGRIPTDKGYRYWVDRLMEPEELTEEEKEWVRGELAKSRSIEGLADKISKVVSELTNSAAVIYIKRLKRVSFLNHLLEELIAAHTINEFLEEDSELFVEGMFRILEQPEFRDFDRMRSLLQAFDEKLNLIAILSRDLEEEGVHVHIGSENLKGHLENVSLVAKDCYIGETPFGGVAAVGPTRMKYPKVVAVVSFVADSVSDVVERF